ncbi:cytochrome oxidase maturation protein, cbb3-type [Ekhidna lutea]|uniref:Cytochrome oxidase maturation protein, cbb3-type n=1 Tax=Ekhidna lutea TaxID=447679 RepID=A0A239L9V7_EKHLU|nr:cbb3-type cytochrome oxidase assembly protein CcoS [Ekhidna lutea]SNT27427.1 cytochrome oxidase maturation protein, cbb3-type [Ekhidna lutea]
MSVIFILIACSLLLAGTFLGAFLWASRSGQFEDDYTPSVRILFEDEEPSVSSKNISNKPSDQCQKTAKK